MDIMAERQYQEREMGKWQREMEDKSRQWFDNVAELSERITFGDEDWFIQQMEWICNGSYGSGACFDCQRHLNRLTPRMNQVAAMGRFFLSAVWGHDFTGWHKLTPAAQRIATRDVRRWLKLKNKGFGQKLIEQ